MYSSQVTFAKVGGGSEGRLADCNNRTGELYIYKEMTKTGKNLIKIFWFLRSSVSNPFTYIVDLLKMTQLTVNLIYTHIVIVHSYYDC